MNVHQLRILAVAFWQPSSAAIHNVPTHKRFWRFWPRQESPPECELVARAHCRGVRLTRPPRHVRELSVERIKET